jgi:hypothetical protein
MISIDSRGVMVAVQIRLTVITTPLARHINADRALLCLTLPFSPHSCRFPHSLSPSQSRRRPYMPSTTTTMFTTGVRPRGSSAPLLVRRLAYPSEAMELTAVHDRRRSPPRNPRIHLRRKTAPRPLCRPHLGRPGLRPRKHETRVRWLQPPVGTAAEPEYAVATTTAEPGQLLPWRCAGWWKIPTARG